jgi:hypothetical protein
MTLNLEERVRRLEAAQRRWRAAAFVAVLAAGLLARVGTGEARPDREKKPERAPTLKVERLEVVDAEGNVRGEFGLDEHGGGRLWVTGAAAGAKAGLEVTKSGHPGLTLRNAAGKAQLIASLPDSGPLLVLADAEGQVAGSLSFRNENGTTLLGMRRPGEKHYRAVLTVMEDGRPYLRLRGEDGDLKIWAKPEFEFTPPEEK